MKSLDLMKKGAFGVLVLGAFLAVAACGGGAAPQAGSAEGNAAGAAGTDLARNKGIYKLGPRDKVRVTVFGEEEISGSYEVDTSGGIALPLVGLVEVDELTLREAEKKVSVALAEFLIKPRVSIEVEENRPFYIFGEVQEGGEFPFVSNMHVLNAVSMAGGYTYRANTRVVYVTRAGTEKEVAVPANSETKIFPGDIVRVGERRF